MNEIGTKFFLVLFIIFLGVVCLFLGLRVMSLTEYSQGTDELRMGAEDLVYFSVGIDCKNKNNILSVTLDCLYDALSYKKIRETAFFNFYDAKYNENSTGYIIITNEALKAYESAGFKLYQNKELVDSGCHITGEIRNGYTCRLEFPQKCEAGDILEVMYAEGEAEEALVLLHVCDNR